MIDNPFGQVLVALVTPFTPDGEVDWPGVEKLMDDVVSAGADGLVEPLPQPGAAALTAMQTATVTPPSAGTGTVALTAEEKEAAKLFGIPEDLYATAKEAK